MTQLGYYSTVYDVENFNFRYKVITKANNRDTIIVETTSKNSLISILKIKYYIDKETGVIIKRTVINKFIFLTIDASTYDRGIKFNVVTNNDIQKPNLTNYTIEETRFPSLSIY